MAYIFYFLQASACLLKPLSYMTIFHLFVQPESADVKDQTSNLFYLYSYFVIIILACLGSYHITMVLGGAKPSVQQGEIWKQPLIYVIYLALLLQCLFTEKIVFANRIGQIHLQ